MCTYKLISSTDMTLSAPYICIWIEQNVCNILSIFSIERPIDAIITEIYYPSRLIAVKRISSVQPVAQIELNYTCEIWKLHIISLTNCNRMISMASSHHLLVSWPYSLIPKMVWAVWHFALFCWNQKLLVYG